MHESLPRTIVIAQLSSKTSQNPYNLADRSTISSPSPLVGSPELMARNRSNSKSIGELGERKGGGPNIHNTLSPHYTPRVINDVVVGFQTFLRCLDMQLNGLLPSILQVTIRRTPVPSRTVTVYLMSALNVTFMFQVSELWRVTDCPEAQFHPYSVSWFATLNRIGPTYRPMT